MVVRKGPSRGAEGRGGILSNVDFPKSDLGGEGRRHGTHVLPNSFNLFEGYYGYDWPRGGAGEVRSLPGDSRVNRVIVRHVTLK